MLSRIVEECNLEDVAECLEGARTVKLTHFQGSSHARLDRIYASLDILPECNSYEVEPVSFSDHCLVKCSFGWVKRGNSFSWEMWKFNNKLLQDEHFTRIVKEEIEKINPSKNMHLWQQWELCKETIKIKAIERATCIRFEEKQKETELRTLLRTLLKQEARAPGKWIEDIRKTKQKLELIDEDRYRGALVRARAEDTAAGEAPSKRALGFEKANAQRNHIDQIDWGGILAADNDHIKAAFNAHYQTLFASHTVDAITFKNKFLATIPRLDDEVKERLELKITETEVEHAIDSLNAGKSPGPDGFSAGFYKEFKYEITPILNAIYNDAYTVNALPPSYGSSHTVLIPKTDEIDKLRLVTSYRPIALTNVEYKIFMKVLARRLQTVIKDIVGPHQTCGIKGRSIVTNIQKARSVLECCDDWDGRVAMLQIDLEKAFDCVDHEILFSLLEHVNVGSVICKGVALAYRNCTTRVIINKSLGAPFDCSVRCDRAVPSALFCFAFILKHCA